MRKATFFYLLRRGLLGAGGFVRDGLVMAASKFKLSGLTHPSSGSAEFDGSSDYILIKEDGKGSAFDTQEFTIGAWAYVKGTNDEVIWSYDFTSHGAPPYYAQHLRFSGGTTLYFFWNNGSTYRDINKTSAVSANEWNYVTATYKSGEQKLYVNGSEVASSTRTQTITYYNQEVWIGKANFGGEFDGNMANVAFWNRALSSDEINSVMWKGYDALEASEKSGLQAWYSLDDVASPAASLATMEALAVDKDATIENKAAVTAAINALS